MDYNFIKYIYIYILNTQRLVSTYYIYINMTPPPKRGGHIAEGNININKDIDIAEGNIIPLPLPLWVGYPNRLNRSTQGGKSIFIYIRTRY